RAQQRACVKSVTGVYPDKLFFFFSSRRRHTRCLSDWSSDVCSSDLASVKLLLSASGRNVDAIAPHHGHHPLAQHVNGAEVRAARSEERRVGKECRSRWWA